VIARVRRTLVGPHLGPSRRATDAAFTVFRRAVLEAIPPASIGAIANTEILVRARAAGFRIRQVPVTHHPRRAGRAKGATLRVIVHALVELATLYRELRAASRSTAERDPALSA
jgi:hypothetical protein